MDTKKMIESYKIGELSIELHTPSDMEKPENLKKFRINQQSSNSIVVELDFSDNLEKIIDELLKKSDGRKISRPDLSLFYVNGKECRVLSFKGSLWPYAVSIEEDNGITAWVNKEIKELLRQDTIFYSMFCLERYMIKKDAMILHCAYLCHNGEAILFSAPSETGKSTQASLWEKYRAGSRTINGDRALIYKKGETWYACGWPICGDSDICFNQDYPIKSIVMLKQNKENQVYPLKPSQAFQEIFAQVTVNGWNRGFQLKAMDMIENLMQEVPVYRQECDISEEAVDRLYEALYGEPKVTELFELEAIL